MRQKAAVVVAVTCLSCLITPQPAHALWGDGWLERLSGPGPFRGNVIDARLLCVAMPDKVAGVESVLNDNPWGNRLTYALGDRAWFTGGGCHFLERDDPRLEIGVDFGFLKSRENVLDYSHLSGISDDDKDVGVRSFAVTADIRVNRVLDVGVAIGRASFRSAGDARLFPSFSKVATQPIRITTRPLAMLWNSRRSEALVLRFDATKFHGTFEAEDFGAKPGTFREPGEITWAWSFRIDPLALLWR